MTPTDAVAFLRSLQRGYLTDDLVTKVHEAADALEPNHKPAAA